MRRSLSLLKRMAGSVRLRVALVAAAAFAITLVLASVLLLRALESRLVGKIRSADESALEAQAVDVLTAGLPVPTVTEFDKPVEGAGTIAFRISGPQSGHTIVATTNGSLDPAFGRGSVNTGEQSPNVFDATISGGSAIDITATQSPIDPDTAQLLGVAGQPGPFLMSTVQVYPGLSLSTASSLAEVNNTLDTTREVLWYAVPALVLLVAVFAWLLVGRALRPVSLVISRAAKISSRSLHERVPVSASGDEVAELATTINSMLDRIEAADVASRRLVSDASHELRTPITVMRTELEVARRDPEASWPDVSSSLLTEIDRLQGLVDDLLLLAQMSEKGVEPSPFSLLDTVRDVAGRRRSVDVAVVDTSTDASDIELMGDGPAVQRALDHVVANAARHATSRVEVTIDAGRDDDCVAVHVDDDGPGIAPCDRTRVLERFERLDEGRSRDAGGSGLGLAVALDVMTAHDGTLEIDESALGGARVTLVLARPERAM
jgi:signal transduction histidine kinase